jgi:hypothetical protein
VQRLIFAPAVAVGVCPQVIVLVLVGLVPRQPSLPVTVRVAVKLPLVEVGVNVAKAATAFWVQVPRAAPPLQVTALKLPPTAAPVIAIAARGVPSHLLIFAPANKVGVCPHVIVLVLVVLVPKHAPLPVTVNVAVKVPPLVVGVNVASAGFAFCVHPPRPPPPVHATPLYVPPAVAPVIEIAARGVPSQRVIVAPAFEVGVWLQVIVLVLVGLVPTQPALPVTVKVAVKLPFATVGVKVASAGSAFCVHEPDPPPPVHVTALKLPPAVAPVIAIADNGVPLQRLILAPAAAVGEGDTVICIAALILLHGPDVTVLLYQVDCVRAGGE